VGEDAEHVVATIARREEEREHDQA
jgi:hypothetical protein